MREHEPIRAGAGTGAGPSNVAVMHSCQQLAKVRLVEGSWVDHPGLGVAAPPGNHRGPPTPCPAPRRAAVVP